MERYHLVVCSLQLLVKHDTSVQRRPDKSAISVEADATLRSCLAGAYAPGPDAFGVEFVPPHRPHTVADPTGSGFRLPFSVSVPYNPSGSNTR